MNGIAQPALLYLVPSIVLPVVVLGLVRGELRQFCSGPEAAQTRTSSSEEVAQNDTEAVENQMIDLK